MLAQLGDACSATDGMAEEPSRTPPQLSAVVRARAGGRTADFGVQRGTRNLCAALRSASLEGGLYQVERPCSHAATPSGPYSYVLDVWGSLSPAPGPRQLLTLGCHP